MLFKQILFSSGEGASSNFESPQSSQGNSSGSGSEPPSSDLTSVQKLKMAVKDYGSTVVVFHIGISLMSLGGFYAAVSRYDVWQNFFVEIVFNGRSLFLFNPSMRMMVLYLLLRLRDFFTISQYSKQ